MSLLNITALNAKTASKFPMRNSIHKFLNVFTLSAMTVLSVSVKSYAQDASNSHELLANLYNCGNLTPMAAQNNCYDQATSALKSAEEVGEVLVINKQDFQKIQESTFGFKSSAISSGQFQNIKTISVPVKKVERYLSGYVVSLDNDQVWEQFAGSIARVPKGQLYAKINVTPTGTYKMVLFNDKARISNIRVRRIK